MMTTKVLALSLSMGLFSFGATAQNVVDHSQHTSAATTDVAPTTAAASSTDQLLSAMEKHMQHMRDMSSKMSATKTDAERQALMADHKKAMRESMTLMGNSAASPASTGKSGGHGAHAGQSGSSAHSGGMGHHMMQRHALMEKRMEMMQTTMQMMMDHMHGPATK